jgi:hypothetical protein
MANEGKAPFWAKMRNAKRRIRVLERSNQSLIRELEEKRTLCNRLQAERDNLQVDCEFLQKQADKANDHFSRALAISRGLLERKKAEVANSCRYDFTGLAEHFDIAISLRQAQEEAAEAGSTLAMLSYETDLEQRAALVHTVAQCLYEYTSMLKAIKVKGGAA